MFSHVHSHVFLQLQNRNSYSQLRMDGNRGIKVCSHIYQKNFKSYLLCKRDSHNVTKLCSSVHRRWPPTSLPLLCRTFREPTNLNAYESDTEEDSDAEIKGISAPGSLNAPNAETIELAVDKESDSKHAISNAISVLKKLSCEEKIEAISRILEK